jgi:uncharacterized membrane protein|tara:strand:- start:8 stop:436 length:429 start_codon:yes stop_codon:yes gene_type:complete
MITDIAIGLVNILGWGIKPLIEKKGLEKTTYFIFANTRYITTAIISIFILLICKRSYVIKNINTDTILYSIVVAIVGLISIISNYYLLSKYDASLVVGLVESSLIMTTLLFSYIFLNEKISLTRIIGMSIISIGILITFLSK